MKRNIKFDYHIYEWVDEDFYQEDLFKSFPSIIKEKYLINLSWDSGYFIPNEDEINQGWKVINNLAHSPKIINCNNIPFDSYDEWYVFNEPNEINKLDNFVNYFDFSPSSFSWKEKLDKFWNQIFKYKPLHVIGEGSFLYLVTRDENLINELNKIEPNVAP